MSDIAYACLWMLTFAIPWEASLIVPGIGTIGRLVGLITAPIGVLAILARGRARPLATIHILCGCFIVWVGMTSAWTLDRDRTPETLQSAIQVVALPWLIWELAGTAKKRFGLFQAYVFGAYVSVFNTLLNFHSGFTTSGHGRLQTKNTGRYAAEGFNPNDLGFLLVLALPLAWHLSLTHKKVLLRWINRLYIPFGMVAILLTGSRSSLIGAALALTIVPLTLRRLSPNMKLGVITIGVVTLMAGALFVPEKTLERLGTTKEEIETGTLNERRIIWKAGLEVYLQHPLLGVGAGAYPEAVEPYLGERKTAHNTYISILVEEGAVGLFLFILILVSLCFHVWAAPPVERRLAIVLFISILIGLLPRAWDFEKPLWLMFGLLLAPSSVGALAAVRYVRRAPMRVPAGPPARAVGQEPAPRHRNSLE